LCPHFALSRQRRNLSTTPGTDCSERLRHFILVYPSYWPSGLTTRYAPVLTEPHCTPVRRQARPFLAFLDKRTPGDWWRAGGFVIYRDAQNVLVCAWDTCSRCRWDWVVTASDTTIIALPTATNTHTVLPYYHSAHCCLGLSSWTRLKGLPLRFAMRRHCGLLVYSHTQILPLRLRTSVHRSSFFVPRCNRPWVSSPWDIEWRSYALPACAPHAGLLPFPTPPPHPHPTPTPPPPPPPTRGTTGGRCGCHRTACPATPVFCCGISVICEHMRDAHARQCLQRGAAGFDETWTDRRLLFAADPPPLRHACAFRAPGRPCSVASAWHLPALAPARYLHWQALLPARSATA